MKNATLRQLKVFEAVARLLSYSRAAEELFLTQPAVSIQIRKLEEHAGNALFEQFGKKIYLTPAGTELLRISRAIIQQFEAAENAMTQFRGVSGGRLNVGVISAGDYFFPRLLVEFAGRHSGVVLNFTVHNREELLARIADNLTDLAIMVRPPADLDAESQPFAPHPYVIVARAEPSPGRQEEGRHGHADAGELRGSREGLGHLEVDGGGLRRAHRATSGSRWRFRSTETIKQAVIAGMGISFLSAHTISKELKAKSLRLLHVQGFPLMLNWYVVHRRNKRLPPVAQAFKDFLLSDGASLISQIVPFDPSR